MTVRLVKPQQTLETKLRVGMKRRQDAHKRTEAAVVDKLAELEPTVPTSAMPVLRERARDNAQRVRTLAAAEEKVLKAVIELAALTSAPRVVRTLLRITGEVAFAAQDEDAAVILLALNEAAGEVNGVHDFVRRKGKIIDLARVRLDASSRRPERAAFLRDLHEAFSPAHFTGPVDGNQHSWIHLVILLAAHAKDMHHYFGPPQDGYEEKILQACIKVAERDPGVTSWGREPIDYVRAFLRAWSGKSAKHVKDWTKILENDLREESRKAP